MGLRRKIRCTYIVYILTQVLIPMFGVVVPWSPISSGGSRAAPVTDSSKSAKGSELCIAGAQAASPVLSLAVFLTHKVSETSPPSLLLRSIASFPLCHYHDRCISQRDAGIRVSRYCNFQDKLRIVFGSWESYICLHSCQPCPPPMLTLISKISS